MSSDLDEDDTEDEVEEDNSVDGAMVEVLSSEAVVVGTAMLVGAKEEEGEDVTDEVEVIDVEVNNDVEAEDETMDVWDAVEDAGVEELLETTVLFTELDILGTMAELGPH